jgi:hypothetical protein
VKLRRIPGSVAVSIAIHVVAIIGLAHVLALPSGFMRLFTQARTDVPAERIGFVSLPSRPDGDATGRIGGDDRPPRTARSQAALRAPTSIPSGIAVAVSPPDRDPEPGSGPLVGRGGPTQGVRPAFRDPRLWKAPTEVVVAPKIVRETVDSMVVADVGRMNDSIAAAPRPPRWSTGDWTVERNGQTYGIDGKFIRLGPVSIPTAVLAMLPLNLQQNPTAAERVRTLSYMNADISYHARRATSEDEFRRAVRNLRERKQRERAEKQTGGNEKERQATPAAPLNTESN